MPQAGDVLQRAAVLIRKLLAQDCGSLSTGVRRVGFFDGWRRYAMHACNKLVERGDNLGRGLHLQQNNVSLQSEGGISIGLQNICMHHALALMFSCNILQLHISLNIVVKSSEF